jgi:UDP-N-acetylglucosamine 2-epimerase (non-hydrolysing)
VEVENGASRSHVLVLFGTRPEAIKMFPLVHALSRSAWFAPVVITTGQHQDLVAPILELAGIEPDFDLGVGHPGLTLNELMATVVTRLDEYCRERFQATGAAVATRSQVRDDGFPVAVLVHGDTTSAMSAAIAAFNLRIPVGHVEAGLRTGSTLTPYPEELNRQLISRIAAFHLAPTSTNRQNLVREEIADEQIYVTGNTGIDALLFAATLEVPFEDPAVTAVVESGAPYVIVTAHRRENWHGGLDKIAAAVARLADAHPDVRFVVPLHPNPLVRRELGGPLEGHAGVVLTEPQAYAQFARLMSGATLVITDSGGIQEEAPALGVPVLVARESTERSEGLTAGTLRLAGTDPERIVVMSEAVLHHPEAFAVDPTRNPYGDGRAAERIVAALEYLAGVGPAPARFGPSFSRKGVLEAAGYSFAAFAADSEPRGAQPDRDEELDRWVGRRSRSPCRSRGCPPGCRPCSTWSSRPSWSSSSGPRCCSSSRGRRCTPRPVPTGRRPTSSLWVFLVPALNEAETIADSVTRLLAVEAARKAVLVIDDGSTDGTASVLAAIDAPELEVLTRMPPDVRLGKAAALNAGWHRVDDLLSAGRATEPPAWAETASSTASPHWTASPTAKVPGATG